jgi:ATP-dependent helicase/nuclease subunit B
MAVQFVLGRSGTGKTTYCLEAIAEALRGSSAQSLLFLVPEQATYEAERAILSAGPIRGYHRLRILSFNRLQFFLTGTGMARPNVSQIGRQMIVHKILRDSREKLQVFRSSALLPRFARQIAETIRELHRYDKTPEDFEALAAEGLQRGARLSAMKFADIATVFGRYSELVRGRFVDPDAQASLACRKIAGADFLQGARLWVDGFASFTGSETTLLVELLRVAGRAHIALAIDPARLSPKPGPSDGLFEPTERTYRDLIEKIEASDIKLDKPLILKKAERFANCPPLAHVEKNIFRLGASRAQAGESIRIVAAPDLRAEAEFVAGQILRLVQQQGHRYRDIAVVASDLGRYEHYIRAYFDDHGIPYFIDQRKPLDRHPVIELLTSALAAVTGGFAHADVFAYLKSDLVPATREQIDVLENYCLAFGVDGRDWVKAEPWQFKGPDDPDFDEETVDAIRRKAVGPLLD